MRTLIPILASDSASHGVAGLIYNGLVKYDKDLKLVGDLAESWDILDNGLKIRFHLRKGILWHDGHPFTAQDVLFTYQTMCDPKTPTAYAGPFLQIKDARIFDDFTFEVTYKSPFAPALESWGLSILPEHLLKGRDIVKSELSRHPIGTAPYIFQSWETGAKIVLKSNPNYFEGRPYIDSYVYRVIPDSATMFLELQSGTIHRMLAENIGMGPEDAGRVKTALVEACINAFEHSGDRDGRVRLWFAVTGGRLVIRVENRGRALAGLPAPAAPGEQPRRRGWGLALMRQLIDEVRIEPREDGVSLVLEKEIGVQSHG